MKALIVITGIFATNFSTSMAKDIRPYDDNYIKTVNEDYKEISFNEEMKVSYLTKLLEHQQKAYDDKISFIETELRKTKDRLIEKSMNQEKIEEAMKEKYSAEAVALKKELAYKTKTLLEYQRQLEKMKPSEDMKKLIKLNTELASELRRSEDQIAFIQLKQSEGTHKDQSLNRFPASVHESK
ncbi:MAG: hypothetical protein ACXVLQ_02710 [Bacteriovorax sp.]